MAGRALFLVVVLIAAACGGGGAATPAPTIPALGGSQNPGTSAGASSGPLLSLPPATGGPLGTDFTPSGAKWRVANLYRDVNGTGTDIDVYGDFNAQAGPKLMTVAYGAVSEYFDPGKLDDQGDAELSFYPAGRTGTDDQIGSQSATLKGNEIITTTLATGENKSPNGGALGRWKTFYENQDGALPTPPTTADSVLMADGIALDAFPNTTETFIYVGIDGTCLPNVGGGASGGGQPFGPGSQQEYLAPAGTHQLTIHPGTPDCTAKSPYPAIPVDLTAGQRAWLFFYTPDDKTLKTLFIPLEG